LTNSHSFLYGTPAFTLLPHPGFFHGLLIPPCVPCLTAPLFLPQFFSPPPLCKFMVRPQQLNVPNPFSFAVYEPLKPIALVSHLMCHSVLQWVYSWSWPFLSDPKGNSIQSPLFRSLFNLDTPPNRSFLGMESPRSILVTFLNLPPDVSLGRVKV